jgi:acyl carrier protein
MAVTLASLREFFDRELGVDPKTLDEQTPLFSSGVVDSLGVMQLVEFITAEAHIKVSASEIKLDNLDTVQRILDFIARKAG